MRKVLLRAALTGALIVSAAGSASARDGTGALLGGAALGVIGGVALGAALAAPPPPPPPYRPRPVFVEEGPPPVYVRPPPPGPICHYEQRKQWLNEFEFTYRRVQVCE